MALKRVISNERRTQIENEANNILTQHNLMKVPVDPVALANKLGIKVKNAVFSDDNISGLIAKRGTSITLLVNQNDPPTRKKFTIAHELGHHFLHLMSQEGEFVDRIENVDFLREEFLDETSSPERKKEVEANYFAAALLMPRPLFEKAIEISHDQESLARMFNVSLTAVENRMNTFNITPEINH